MTRNKKTWLVALALGANAVFAPCLFAQAQQQTQPDLQQDRKAEAEDRAVRTRDDRAEKQMGDEIHRLQAERNQVASRVVKDKLALNQADQNYAADRKKRANDAQLEKDRTAVEKAKSAYEKDSKERALFDDKISQKKEEFARIISQRNRDNQELKSEEQDIRADASKQKGQDKQKDMKKKKKDKEKDKDKAKDKAQERD